MKCLICNKFEAFHDQQYGYLPCTACRKRQSMLSKPQHQVEFVGEDIKEQRKAYAQDIRPAHRKGYLDKGFVDAYGTQKAKDQGYSDKEIKNAKYVWSKDEDYYNKGN